MEKIFSANLTIEFVSPIEFSRAPKEIDILIDNNVAKLTMSSFLLINTQKMYAQVEIHADTKLSSLDEYLKVIKQEIERMTKSECDAFSKIEDLMCLTSDEEASLAYSVEFIEDILAVQKLLNEISIIDTKVAPYLKAIAEARSDFRQEHLKDLKFNLNEMKPKFDKILSVLKKIN